jgi:hypothetical protein
MKTIAQAAAGSLKGAQVSTKHHELRSQDEVIATLEFRNVFGTLGTAKSGDGCFTFKRVGFWQSRASIRACESDAELAGFVNNTWASGGTLEFPDGRKYKATTNFWTTRLEFTSEADESLVRFHYGGMFKKKADVEVSETARRDPHAHLLVTFGWYLVIMLRRDAAVAATL